jgi:capsular exopolysaccharide synthesis family protein
MIRKKTEPEKSIFAYYDDESSKATEFRRLAKNIRHYGNPSEVRSILVTSAAKSEGKSIVAANLAIALAKREVDKRVVLLDCDLRRPVIHSLFLIKKNPGLVSLLNDEIELSKVIRDTELDNLKIIPSGHTIHSPIQILINIKEVLDKCRESFDIVICDTPPIIPVDDTGVIAPHVDGTLLVVMAGVTDKLVVKRAVEMLNDMNAKILGIALNNRNKTLPYYYDYNYYRYKYNKLDKKEG